MSAASLSCRFAFRARVISLLAVVLLMPGSIAEAAALHPFDAATVKVRSYFDTDGLPQNSVESMSLDQDGRLWVTTRDGGAVFDGTTWTTVPMPDPKGSNWPRKVLATSDGSVWFSVESGGLHRRTGEVWRTWNESNGLEGRVNAMIEDGGSLLVGTTAGLYALRLSAPTPVMELGQENVVALSGGEHGMFALTADGAILRRSNRSWQLVPGKQVDGARPVSLLATEHGTLIGTSDGIVLFTDDGSARRWETDVRITALAQTTSPNGIMQLWAATEGSGLLMLVDGSWESASPRISLPNRFVYDLLPSPKDGPAARLLAGTLSGVARIDLAAWRQVGTSEGLPEASVVSMMQSRAVFPGAYFLGTTGGLARFGGSGRWKLSTCSALQQAGVFAMYESVSTGLVYVGTADGVVGMSDSGCRRIPGLVGVSVVAMLETHQPSSRLWAGTYGEGVWFLGKDGSWLPSELDLPDNRVEALARSGKDDETLWIATNDGLARLSEGAVRFFDQDSGIPHNLVRSLLVHDNELWVGTARGLARANLDTEPLRWNAVDLRADGRMQNDTVYRIEAGPAGRIYAFTGRGIARLDLDEASGEYRLGRIFLSDDGLPSSETNFGASMIDSDGRIWAGTPLGAGILDPALESESESAARSHRLAIDLRTEPDGVTIRSGDVLSADVDRVVASYRLIDLAHGYRAVYRTELVGLDEEPGLWTSSAQRVFSKLPGGRFELRVWARDPHGHDAGPEIVSFSVQQPPWLSWWAVLIYVAAAVIALYTFVGLRLRSLRRRNQELELIVRSRTRDLEVANRQLESANVTLADMSVTDPLTGARNRRYLLQKMEQEAVRVRRSTRESDDIVFLLVDIDRFKYVNDRFGHATGDHILKQFHRILVSAVRDTDTIVRWGGEEFLIVARRISRNEATILAERILQMVRDMRFETSDTARSLRLTCSVGFATFPFVTWDRSLFTWEQVVDIADHCLYAVKRSGRDGWVGLAAAPQLRPDSFLSRMRDDVDALAAAEEITILASLDEPSKLSWR
jgi:diguanylate cyclase (GGDEF)-like protein